jgi:transposase
MPCRLRKEEIVTIQVLAQKGIPKTEVARQLGVCEGTVRYHLRRQATGAEDGRADKAFLAEVCSDAITHWIETRSEATRPVNVKELWEHLVEQYGYEGSYRSVLRYVRARYPRPRIRTYRRVETVPGAQTQTDWAEYPLVDVGEGPAPLSAFVMVLSFCRMPTVLWCRAKDLLSWLWCHNRAYERLAGIAAVNRIDNVKTAIVRGAGSWGEIHPTYRSYARAVGFHIDACQPRQANAKGKAEAKVRLSRLRLDPGKRPYDSLEELQEQTDRRIERWARRAICPATGETVYASWQDELERLAPLPRLPEPFDVAVTRPVHKDCLVYFEDRQYGVPFRYVGTMVEVRGCLGQVQILAQGQVVKEWPRRTAQRIWVDESCYAGEATDRVLPPPPLGRMGRRLQELYNTPVEQRPLDLYAALAEVAR